MIKRYSCQTNQGISELNPETHIYLLFWPNAPVICKQGYYLHKIGDGDCIAMILLLLMNIAVGHLITFHFTRMDDRCKQDDWLG